MSRTTMWILAAGAGVLLAALGLTAAFFPEMVLLRGRMGGPAGVIVVPRHGFVGVLFDPAAPPMTIGTVMAGSGAAEAGLLPGDVLIGAAGVKTPDAAALGAIVEQTHPGETLRVAIRRGTQEIEASVRLITYQELRTMLDQR